MNEIKSGPRIPLDLKPIKNLSSYITSFVQTRLWLKIILAMVMGVLVGGYFASGPSWASEEYTETLMNWIALPGNIFIRLIQMIMIPLMFSSIIQGIAGGDNKEFLKSAGPKVTLYFMLTSVVTITLAVALALVIEPGAYMSGTAFFQEALNVEVSPPVEVGLRDLPNMLTSLLPENPLSSMVAGEMLSIVIFAFVIGTALANLPQETALPTLKILYSVQETAMLVTRWAMKIAPVAVFGLICQVTSKVGFETISGLSMFILTVLLGMLLVLIFYSLLLLFVAKTNVRTFFRESRNLMLLAFSLSSSAAVMPLTLKTAEENLKVSPSVSRFVIPVGVSINMDGTAVFQAIATIFLAQVYGLELNLMSLILVIVTSIAASLGTPSAPGAGVIVLGSVLSSIGIPVTAIALIIGVDRLLGMFRTSINVVGDLVACMIFDRNASPQEGLSPVEEDRAAG